MKESIVFTDVLMWIFLVACLVAIIAAAIWVQKASGIALQVASIFVIPFAGIIRPICRILLWIKEAIDELIFARREPPEIIKKFGDWKLIIFMLAILAATIRMIAKICINTDLYTLIQIILANTTIGGFSELFEGVKISVTMCFDILIFSMFTGWFVRRCSKLSLPIQLLYDTIFIIFTALLLEMLPDFRYSFMPEEWWSIFKFSLPDISEGTVGDKAFLSVLADIIPVWNTLLNRLLLFISLLVAAAFIIAAIGNIASSILGGIAAVVILGIASLFMNEWLERIPETVGMILVLMLLILVELLIFNSDRFLSKESEEEEISVLEAIVLDENDEKFPVTTLCLGSYFGTPVIGIILLVIIASFFSLPMDGEEVMAFCQVILSCILIFLLCCVPAMISALISSRGRWEEVLGAIVGTVMITPWMAVFYIIQALLVWVLGLIFKIT